MKIALYALWALATLPLLVYPFLAAEAWRMISASSYYDGPARDARLAVAVGVMWLAFPVIYFVGFFLFRSFMKQASRFGPAIWTTALPIGYLIALALLTMIWICAEKETIEAGRHEEAIQCMCPTAVPLDGS